MYGKDRNVIKGNTIVNTERGIMLDADFDLSTSNENKVLDNTVISSNSDGIIVFGGKRNVIQGNTIDQSGVFGQGQSGSGIKVKGPNGSTIINEGVIIKDNSITNSRQDGIVIGDGTLNTVVIGNTFAGNGNNDNIDDQGTGTVKAGNIPSLM